MARRLYDETAMRLATLMLASLTWLFSQGCVSSVTGLVNDGTTREVDLCSAYDVCPPGGGRGDGIVPLVLGSALVGAMGVAVVRHLVAKLSH